MVSCANKNSNIKEINSQINNTQRKNSEISLYQSEIENNKKLDQGNTINENFEDKKIILRKYDKKLFACLNNTMLPRDISEESFDMKFENLRCCLEEIKVDWREAHCDLKISRANMLEDTLKKVVFLDPYKVFMVFYFNYFFILIIFC